MKTKYAPQEMSPIYSLAFLNWLAETGLINDAQGRCVGYAAWLESARRTHESYLPEQAPVPNDCVVIKKAKLSQIATILTSIYSMAENFKMAISTSLIADLLKAEEK